MCILVTVAVAQCFGGAMIEDYGDAVRARQDQERAAWQAIVDDPDETDEFRDRARHDLARLAGGAHVGAQDASEAAGW